MGVSFWDHFDIILKSFWLPFLDHFGESFLGSSEPVTSLNEAMRAFMHWLCFGLNAAMRAFVHWLPKRCFTYTEPTFEMECGNACIRALVVFRVCIGVCFGFPFGCHFGGHSGWWYLI